MKLFVSMWWCSWMMLPLESMAIEAVDTRIFISFSMPKQSLKLWSEQSKAIGARLVLQGFVDNSLKKTIAATREVFGTESLSSIEIDPESFNRFQVKVVPSVVLIGKDQACLKAERCGSELYDKVTGDIGLVAALHQIEQQGSFKVEAKNLLAQLKGAS